MAEVLTRVRAELQRLDLWEAAPPAPHRLASAQPFSWDTLMFHQWLQWQFLPRMSAAIAGEEVWPRDSAIFPYAEECLAGGPEDVRALLFLIETLDELICEGSDPGPVNAERH